MVNACPQEHDVNHEFQMSQQQNKYETIDLTLSSSLWVPRVRQASDQN